ncbi:hypothetical protein ACFP2T_10715 [Plantactinospora solaniradicis]|uniref:Anti-sigma-D factor RsdA sigma factor binding region domain-containing protein n=1 Tax=Plantactinospora solaniradicis TaxID=1723736 RepID=A0ABW1K614_9ACTN
MSNLRDGGRRGDGVGERSGDVTGRDGDPVELADPVDLEPAVLVADDLLLDALGRGAAAPADDPIAGLMAAWRADLDAEQPAGPVDDAVPARTMPATVRAPARVRPPRPGPPVGPRRPGQLRSDPPRPVPGRRPRRTGLVRRLGLVAVVAIVATALLGLGVNEAGPTSPLWPIAAAVYPDRSAVRVVEHTLTLAEDAVAAGRYDDARSRLDQALVQVAEVRHPEPAERLRADIERIRRGLPGTGPDEIEPDTSTTSGAVPAVPVPATSSTDGGPAPTRTPGGAASPAGRPPAASDPAPADPSPRQVLPLPVPVLPSLLPSGLPLLPSGGCVLLCPPD